MFSDKVETVISLSQRKPDDNIDIELNLDEIDITPAEKKCTYSTIQKYVLENTGLKVSTLNISQVKKFCGLKVGNNYNVSKNENTKTPTCPEAKVEAIKAAFRYFGLI